MTLQSPISRDVAAPDLVRSLREPARSLVRRGDLDPSTARVAQDMAETEGLDLGEILSTRFSVSQRSLLLATHAGHVAQHVDLMPAPPDPTLVRMLGAARCLTWTVLPWRRIGDCVIVLAPRLEVYQRHLPHLEAVFGAVRLALCTTDEITGTIARRFHADLVTHAETRLPLSKSSRNWNARWALVGTLAAVSGLIALTIVSPMTVLTVLTILAVVCLLLNGAVKVAAACFGNAPVAPPDRLPQADLPLITLLIPLYRERAIAEHLLTRLEALDYPRERLDVCLVLEDNDHTTRHALSRVRLLSWMRAIVVPKGTLRTKPRALNYALPFARGSIVGVYDAEDAPAIDQLQIVAATFAKAGPGVACLQGILDYYNSSANWLTRCFTIEYASWFRVVLPGYARMGLVVPLGGTTLFFRRDVLEDLGAWDAHNVTEDADLGIRLARAGYETVFIPTVTEEEANGRFWPWIKQRSRWLKGYGVTYAVHMRRPLQLWRDLGAWRFFGLQVLFAGTLAQFLLAPLVWSFWLIPLGLPHPAAALLSGPAFLALAALFVLSELANFAIATLASLRARKGWLIPWALSLQLYFPLGAVAAYKGLLELTWKPFFWDKTMHGVLLPQITTPPPPPEPARHPVSAG